MRILIVLVGVLVVAIAAVTAFFTQREPVAEVPAAAAPVDPASASVAPAAQ
ncbi:MAG: hypothetical protein H0W40_13085 [Methylibium sp.]|uniref:hypothetical protein n=1 Tax=Methylibium sp. TaxID=2067992 RepID=UPI0017F433DB|nr:hypothetical protein [Methylibium sp.]MBA3598291.1 hypothetical protein [Methylibium sp.]